MTQTLVNGYTFESTRRELSNEYQYDRVKMIFKNLCIRVLLTVLTSALEEFNSGGTSGTLLMSEAHQATSLLLKTITISRVPEIKHHTFPEQLA